MSELISEWEAYNLYDEMLDECGTVDVLGMEYEVSRALKELDPIRYELGFTEYLETLAVDEQTLVVGYESDYAWAIEDEEEGGDE
jgi:hypothetical protein